MKSILVIDDNKDIRENTAEILEMAGYKTFTAENGKKGVDLALREKPNVIVCDIMMPRIGRVRRITSFTQEFRHAKYSFYISYC